MDSLLLHHLKSPVLYVVVYTCQSRSPNSSHTLLPPLGIYPWTSLSIPGSSTCTRIECCPASFHGLVLKTISQLVHKPYSLGTWTQGLWEVELSFLTIPWLKVSAALWIHVVPASQSKAGEENHSVYFITLSECVLSHICGCYANQWQGHN